MGASVLKCETCRRKLPPFARFWCTLGCFQKWLGAPSGKLPTKTTNTTESI